MGYDYFNDQNKADLQEVKSALKNWDNQTVSTFTPNIQNELLATV